MNTDAKANQGRPFYKRIVFWLILAGVIVVAVAGILIGSVIKVQRENSFKLESVISQTIKEHNLPDEPEYDIIATESHVIYGKSRSGNQLTVYMNAHYQRYSTNNTLGIVEEDGGGWCPIAITFEVDDDGNYKLLEYWEPGEGSYYASSIKDKFPSMYAYFAIANVIPPPQPDMSEVYEHFNEPKCVSFSCWDFQEVFIDRKAVVTLTLNTETGYATLTADDEEILKEKYYIFNFDEKGNSVAEEYIYLCDEDNIREYRFSIGNEDLIYVSNLSEKPVFTRVAE